MADNDSPLEYPLPPANFTFLVESVLMQTQIRLGLLSFGEKDEKPNEPNLPLARHSIDMLSMLQEKTRGNLTIEEQRLIENGLTATCSFQHGQSSSRTIAVVDYFGF